MSGYVPNNRDERKPPPTPPYNGDFNTQPARTVEGTTSATNTSLVGIRFVWDNGECLDANIPFSLQPAEGNVLKGALNAQGCVMQTIPGREYEAQLLADVEVDAHVAAARTELQGVLDEIITAEQAEAAKLQAIQNERSAAMNALHKGLAFGKGLFMAGVGMVDSAMQLNDLISPHTYLSNALRSAWNADASDGSWMDSFRQNFTAEQHRELVEALGFDPSSITREQLAQAYEIANFIYDDAPSKAMLGRFAVDYAKAQNAEEIAEFSGGAAFEIVLTAVLAVLTGGAFLAAKAATSLRHLKLLQRLGNALTKLAAALRRARIKAGGKARGNGTGAQTVELPRPEGVKADSFPRTETTPPTDIKPRTPVHSQYPDGTTVMEGQQPGKVKGPISESPHSVIQWDETNNRVYKAREYGADGVPIRDIDFTHPTYPNGKLRPDHSVPEQHIYIPNDPNNPKAGYKRGKGQPLEFP
ncbi:hypothetical protein [Pseudomonas sp. BMW13]|uniref:hypothetical protein n=1 Tax=Pseudomonas sp. BMW13 TaxID=2562590 RepID=UPI001581EC80|nr:hypothetical protein [Pseudomonas sp. BMW13]